MSDVCLRKAEVTRSKPSQCEGCKSFDKERLKGHGNLHAKIMIIDESPSRADIIRTEFLSGQYKKILEGFLDKAEISKDDIYFTSLVKCPISTKKISFKVIKQCKFILEAEIKNVKPNIIVALGATALKAFALKGSPVLSDVLLGVEYLERYDCKIIYSKHVSSIFASLENKPILERAFHLVKEEMESNKLLPKKPVDYKILKTIKELEAFRDQMKEIEWCACDLETTGFNFLYDSIILGTFAWKPGVARCIVLLNREVKKVICPICNGKGTVERKKKTKPTKTLIKRKVKPLTCHKCKGKGKVDKSFGIPYFGKDQDKAIAIFKEIMEGETKKIFQNYKFDKKFFITYKIQPKNMCFDTMLAHFLINENLPHDLSFLCKMYTDMAWYDKPLLDYKVNNEVDTYLDVPTELLAHYGMGDTDATFRVYKKLDVMIDNDDYFDFYKYEKAIKNYIKEDKGEFAETLKKKLIDQIKEIRSKRKDEGLRRVFYNIMLPLQEVLADVEYRGVLVDLPRVKELEKEKGKKILELEGEMCGIIGNPDFNPRSTKQLKDVLFNFLKLTTDKKTAGGSMATDEEVLNSLVKKDKTGFVKALVQHRKEAKLLSTYIKGVQKLIFKDNTVHTSYLLHGSRTGRLASRRPNMQNIPRDEAIQSMFTARPGYKFVASDFGQAEIRCLVEYAKDPNMIKIFTSGKDIHKMIGSQALGIPYDDVTGEQRVIAKGIVFGIIYGRGPMSIAEELGVSLRSATDFRDKFFRAYPKVYNWINGQHMAVKIHKQVRSIFGRTRRLPDIDIASLNPGDNFKVAEACRQAQNAPIQSAAADITCLAMIKLHKRIQKENLGMRIIMNIHDAIYFEVPEKTLKRDIKIIRECMIDPIPKSLGINLVVPMDVEIKVGNNWGELEEAEHFITAMDKRKNMKVKDHSKD